MIKLWVCMQTLNDTNSLGTWFLFIMSDAYFLYVFDFTKNVAQQPNDYQPSQEESESTKQKFIGVFLWLIGFFLALIFGENRKVASLSIIVAICAVGESVVLKISREGNIMQALYSENVDQ